MKARTRRTFLASAAAGLGVSALPFAASGEERLRVLVVGASVMTGPVGWELDKALRRAGFEFRREAKGNSGIARPDYFNWPEVAGELYRTFRPHATVVMFGGNDAQGLRMPRGTSPPWIRWHEDGWPSEYARRVAAFADVVAPNGEPVFWLGLAAMRQKGFDDRSRKINRIVRHALEGRPRTFYVDTRSILGREGKRYVDHLVVDGKQMRIREPDGVHITVGGGRVLASRVIPMIQAALAEPRKLSLGLRILVELATRA